MISIYWILRKSMNHPAASYEVSVIPASSKGGSAFGRKAGIHAGSRIKCGMTTRQASGK